MNLPRRARKPSDRERDPQFQERNWPRVRESLLDDEPLVPALEEDLLTEGFTRALKLTGDQAIPAVQRLAERVARNGAAPNPRDLARAVLAESSLSSAAGRKPLVDAPRGHLRVLHRSGDRVRPRSVRDRSQIFARASGSSTRRFSGIARVSPGACRPGGVRRCIPMRT